jgi:enediyne biosynthesis protein E4
MNRATIACILMLSPATFAAAAEPALPLPVFTDMTEKAGIRFRHCFGDDELSNIVEGTGSGATFFDYDGDGWLDIYLVNGRYRPDVNDVTGRKYKGKLSNKLYRNNRDGTFTDVTEKAGVGGGEGFGIAASAADYDGDGNVDLYVLNYGPNVLYHNNGDGTFTDVSAKSGLADPRWSVSGVWFDYDRDGKLDVYVANYLEYDGGKFRSYYPAAGYPGPLSYNGTSGALYRNNGDGTFSDVTKAAGVLKPGGRAMSATAADLDNRGLLDLYVANDSMANYLFRNLGDGKFVEEALPRGIAFGEGGQGVSNMGPTFGDIDRDGRMDLFIPNLGYGTLLMNRGKYFVDRTAESGLAVICGQYAGWGSGLFDYDNDGYLDLFVATGGAHHLHPEESVLARNDGKGRFTDVAKRSGAFFTKKYVARGVAVGDYDNDGHLDLLVVTLDGPAILLHNDGGSKNNWLTVVCKLPNGKTDAIGARVTVKTGGLAQIHDLVPVTGYLSQSDPRPHFGLGKAKKADAVEVRWPDGRVTTLKDVPANQFLKVVQEKREEAKKP